MSLRDTLQKHNFKFKKRYGQNFITDPGIINKIVSTAEIFKDDIVLEIGPGAGALTRALAQKARRVIAVEIDSQLIPVLSETLAGFSNVNVIQGDALEMNMDELVEKTTGKKQSYKIVANLPYYITTPLVMHFLESDFNIKKIVIMVQKEVAERFNACPGTKEYGALTVSVNYYAKARLAFLVPKHIFTPKPDVDSAVVDMEIFQEPPVKVKNINILRTVVKAAFNQRRKTLLNALKVLGIEKEQIAEILLECSILPQRRGETLSLEEFVKIADRLSEIIK